jgi:hypothetical protein
MSEEELKAIASEIVQGSIDDYNSIYGTQYTENDISEEQIALILLFLLMSWGGWAAVKDIVDTPIEFNYITKTFGDNYQQYKGVNETTRRRIESLTNSDERILALLEEIDIDINIVYTNFNRRHYILGHLMILLLVKNLPDNCKRRK